MAENRTTARATPFDEEDYDLYWNDERDGPWDVDGMHEYDNSSHLNM